MTKKIVTYSFLLKLFLKKNSYIITSLLVKREVKHMIIQYIISFMRQFWKLLSIIQALIRPCLVLNVFKFILELTVVARIFHDFNTIFQLMFDLISFHIVFRN